MNAADVKTAARIIEVGSLSPQQVRLIQDAVAGAPMASLTKATGMTTAQVEIELSRPEVVRVIGYMREQQMLVPSQWNIDREFVTDMIMESYHKADSAMDIRLAATALADLHGLKVAPKTTIDVNHTHKHSYRFEQMSDDALMELAGQDDITLTDADYVVIDDDDTDTDDDQRG